MNIRKNKENNTNKENKDLKALYVLKRLLQYIGTDNKRYTAPLIVLIIFNLLFNLFSPLVFRHLIDVGIGSSLGGGGSGGNIEIIIFDGILYFILTILIVLSRISQGYIIQKLATITMYNLRYEIFTKFQILGLDYHDNPNSSAGKKISYLTNDVNTIQELIESGLLVIVGNFFLLIGALGFMIILSPQLTLVLLLIIPFFGVIVVSVFKKARKFYKELRENISSVTSAFDESILGMREIQTFAIEEEFFNEFNEVTKNEKKISLKSAKLFALIPGLTIFVFTLGIGLLFFTAGILIRDSIITVGTLISFIFYLFQFFEPLNTLVGFFAILQNAIAAGARMIKLIDLSPSIKQISSPIKLEEIKGEIEYKDISFYYEKENPVIDKINIKIKEKERLALVGYTGAGKSTFIKLLNRFYDPIEGNITIDGVNLRNIDLKSLRGNMGVVFQENFLFSGTIMDNIKYGKLNATDEEALKAAKQVNAHNFIIELEFGYQTLVGERGNNLSEGERQLIAFARALIGNPPILILDEATSAVDPFTETLIIEAILSILKNRTSISIAHRLSTIINSDRILVLDKGKIIEEGSHEELLKKKGFYQHLFEMQFKDPYKQ
ncbi:MAG: ABC transporter ATP-binding protein [Candidatus Lokiarchaeota archaeon]|nr:ABC transporter ATP-binding protein [Candidatus Lokiarchaeota archaeon]